MHDEPRVIDKWDEIVTEDDCRELFLEEEQAVLDWLATIGRKRDQSRVDFRVAVSLYRQGCPEHIVEGVLLNSPTIERKNDVLDYIRRTMAAAFDKARSLWEEEARRQAASDNRAYWDSVRDKLPVEDSGDCFDPEEETGMVDVRRLELPLRPRGDQFGMEFPIYSLRPRVPHRPIVEYQRGEHFVEVHPGEYGLPSVHDRDVILYLTTCLAVLLDQERQVHGIRTSVSSILRYTRRGTSGASGRELRAALNRLAFARIRTNVLNRTVGRDDTVRLLRFRFEPGAGGGRRGMIELIPGDWLAKAVEKSRILSYDPCYFGIRSAMRRRMYEVCRKHCGRQKRWRIHLQALQAKMGSHQETRKFRAALKGMDIPEYELRPEGDFVTVQSRA